MSPYAYIPQHAVLVCAAQPKDPVPPQPPPLDKPTTYISIPARTNHALVLGNTHPVVCQQRLMPPLHPLLSHQKPELRWAHVLLPPSPQKASPRVCSAAAAAAAAEPSQQPRYGAFPSSGRLNPHRTPRSSPSAAPRRPLPVLFVALRSKEAGQATRGSPDGRRGGGGRGGASLLLLPASPPVAAPPPRELERGDRWSCCFC